MNSQSNSVPTIVQASGPFVPSGNVNSIPFPPFQPNLVSIQNHPHHPHHPRHPRHLSTANPINFPPLEPGPVIPMTQKPKWNDPFNDVAVDPITESSYYRYYFNNHDAYTNYKLIRFRDILQSDVKPNVNVNLYPIVQSDVYTNYKYVQ